MRAINPSPVSPATIPTDVDISSIPPGSENTPSITLNPSGNPVILSRRRADLSRMEEPGFTPTPPPLTLDIEEHTVALAPRRADRRRQNEDDESLEDQPTPRLQNTPRVAEAGDGTGPKKPLVINVYIHDDLYQEHQPYSFYGDYFSWLEKELESITSRDVIIEMKDKRQAPELTNYDYKHSDFNVANQGWEKRVKEHLGENQSSAQAGPPPKHLLFTESTITDGVVDSIEGVALYKGDYGIASNNFYTTPAHEIGHMLGATHEDSEVVYKDGWWFDTNMKSDLFSALRGNSYTFSDANRENIRRWSERFP